MSSSSEIPAAAGSSHAELDVFTPVLPPARFVELPDRGTVMVRDFGAAPDAPAIVLLHGWTATADLNWFRCYAALGERYRVIAFDHRGHGTGLRSKKPFRLEDCADDAVDRDRRVGRRQRQRHEGGLRAGGASERRGSYCSAAEDKAVRT